LTKKEMKNVKGGLAAEEGLGGTVGTCQILFTTAPGQTWVGTGATLETVKQFIKSGDVKRWCCDSCSTASWAVH
jgi:hypothetical protein